MLMGVNLKNIMGPLFLIIGMLCIINGIAAKIHRVSFSSFFIVIGILLLSLGIFERFILNSSMPSITKYLISSVHILTLIFFISFTLIEAFIIISAIRKDTERPDFIVILGAGLRGETPSHTLYRRLETSLSLINQHKDVKVILSGGQGPGESITEAEAMRRYLIDRGISSERLIKEDKSTNTLENLYFTKDIITTLGDKEHPSITIVTSNFHMLRSKLLAKRIGLVSFGYPAEIHHYLVPTYFIREYLALVKSLVFDWPY